MLLKYNKFSSDSPVSHESIDSNTSLSSETANNSFNLESNYTEALKSNFSKIETPDKENQKKRFGNRNSLVSNLFL